MNSRKKTNKITYKMMNDEKCKDDIEKVMRQPHEATKWFSALAFNIN